MILLGENRGALSTIRSLGKKGIPVYVGGSRFLARACFSRYCRGRFTYPSFYFGIDKMHKAILKNVKKFQPDVILPSSYDTIYTVLSHLEEYEKYSKIVPNIGIDNLMKFYNKETMIKEAMRVGCPVPKTYFPADLNELRKIAGELPYPVLIKPRLSGGGKGIAKATKREELMKGYQKITIQEKTFNFDPERPVIQEFIYGQRYSVTGIFDRGRHKGSVVFENYRHYPTYGSPLLNMTVKNEEVRRTIVTMFEKLKWHGPFNVQCAVDPRDGMTKLFEINPRLWACIGSTIAAGLDVPQLAYKMALGEKIEEKNDYQLNQKHRWVMFGELFYLLRSRDRLKLLKNYHDFNNTVTDVEFTDPLPHLIQLLDLIVNRQVI